MILAYQVGSLRPNQFLGLGWLWAWITQESQVVVPSAAAVPLLLQIDGTVEIFLEADRVEILLDVAPS